MPAWTVADVRRLCFRVEYAAVQLQGGGVVLTLPDLPPSLNEWQRWHWAERHAQMRRLAGAVSVINEKGTT